jgi:hypothetical protein
VAAHDLAETDGENNTLLKRATDGNWQATFMTIAQGDILAHSPTRLSRFTA